MSSYTIRLKSLLDSGFEIWDESNPYPIAGEDAAEQAAHRQRLQKMIEDHYLMQEIGFETPQLFKHFLNQRMREIMPKFNAMYTSIPTYNAAMKIFKETSRTAGSVNDSGSFTKGAQQDISYDFDTPMNMGSITAASPDHMSGANRTDYGTRSDSTTRDSSDDHTTTIDREQSPFETIRQYRQFEFNIDLMIIDELADLFMMIF